MNKPPDKKIPFEKIIQKIERYCAYQDRCNKEVRTKLRQLGIVEKEKTNGIIEKLTRDQFLNEERFARSFVRGKFHFKNWGRNKIRMELKFRNIEVTVINSALEEIREEEYQKVLLSILNRKNELLKEPDLFKRKIKLTQFALRKGFENSLILESIEKIFK